MRFATVKDQLGFEINAQVIRYDGLFNPIVVEYMGKRLFKSYVTGLFYPENMTDMTSFSFWYGK